MRCGAERSGVFSFLITTQNVLSSQFNRQLSSLSSRCRCRRDRAYVMMQMTIDGGGGNVKLPRQLATNERSVKIREW